MSYLNYHFPNNVKAFSTCRDGGFSEGAYASFNCTHYCGDEDKHVIANRRKLCNDWQIPTDRLIIPRQVHGTKIATIDDFFLTSSAENQVKELDGVDALVSPLSNVCLSVSTADCIPILLYDTHTHVIGAIHAGWRGTVAHIVSLTLQRMKNQYGVKCENIHAAIGPGISLEAFEVGDEVYEAFQNAGFPMKQIASRYEKWHIDLWEANRMQLINEGVRPDAIEVAGICTYQQADRFFSARRLGLHSGRILTGIMQINEVENLK